MAKSKPNKTKTLPKSLRKGSLPSPVSDVLAAGLGALEKAQKSGSDSFDALVSLGSKVVERGLDVQPTLRISPGHRFTVFLARDLAFAAPYRTAPAEPRFTRPRAPRSPHGGADR